MFRRSIVCAALTFYAAVPKTAKKFGFVAVQKGYTPDAVVMNKIQRLVAKFPAQKGRKCVKIPAKQVKVAKQAAVKKVAKQAPKVVAKQTAVKKVAKQAPQVVAKQTAVKKAAKLAVSQNTVLTAPIIEAVVEVPVAVEASAVPFAEAPLASIIVDAPISAAIEVVPCAAPAVEKKVKKSAKKTAVKKEKVYTASSFDFDVNAVIYPCSGLNAVEAFVVPVEAQTINYNVNAILFPQNATETFVNENSFAAAEEVVEQTAESFVAPMEVTTPFAAPVATSVESVFVNETATPVAAQAPIEPVVEQKKEVQNLSWDFCL